MTDLPADFWENRFRERRTPWERGALNPAFLGWRASGVMAPCRILVPGAGKSPEPSALLEAGFDVVALDLAESAIAMQAERLGTERAIMGDVTRWQPDRRFDAIYDQTCLCALPAHLWAAYEAKLRDWIRPGGSLFMLFMHTGRVGGPPFDCPMPAMRSLFAGWIWPDTLAEPIPHNLGTFEQPALLTAPPCEQHKGRADSAFV